MRMTHSRVAEELMRYVVQKRLGRGSGCDQADLWIECRGVFLFKFYLSLTLVLPLDRYLRQGRVSRVYTRDKSRHAALCSCINNRYL